ncbi:MAG: tRNA isopentenyl-2-thiomethyl-A-37 hydroxylase MiaE [Planctomycetota bacterium]
MLRDPRRVRPILCLRAPTGPEWVGRVLPHRNELLLEQAHLERKAASAALTFMFTHQEFAVIQVPLSELAREELSHYELVLAQMRRLGLPFARQVPCTYAASLRHVVRGREPERGLDSMLVCALIEARSCERMRLLGEALVPYDPELAAMYGDLTVSEARHHALYVELAQACYPEHDVLARLREVAEFEARVLMDSAPQPRLHG